MRFEHPLFYRRHCSLYHEPDAPLTVRKYYCKVCIIRGYCDMGNKKRTKEKTERGRERGKQKRAKREKQKETEQKEATPKYIGHGLFL